MVEKFTRNAAAPPYLDHRIAIRDRRFKLIYHWTDRRAMHLFDLSADPLEQENLLQPVPPPPGTPAGDALLQLTSRVHALLGT